MSEPQHCSGCDLYGCAGFTTPRATPEPVPALRPERVASDEARKAYIEAGKAAVDAVRRELKGAAS